MYSFHHAILTPDGRVTDRNGNWEGIDSWFAAMKDEAVNKRKVAYSMKKVAIVPVVRVSLISQNTAFY